MHTTAETRRRPRLAVLAVAAMVLTLLAPPTTATAHSNSCMPTVSSVLHAVVEAVNVFAPVIESRAAECTEQFEDVEPVMERDYVVAAADQPAARGKGAASSAPTSKAPCKNGLAAGMFPCKNVNMWSHVPMADLGDEFFVNDMWGWTDGKDDYALVGGATGMHVVDISDKLRPVVMGIVPSAKEGPRLFWRDIKVFEDRAYIVSEHTDHGVQVFDLTRLRDWDGEYTTWEADARYTGIGSSHNIGINTETGYAYVVGAAPFEGGTPPEDCGNGIHMLDVNEPGEPNFAGCFQEHDYVHDVQCVIYRGPDSEHRGKEICVNSNGIDYGGENYLSIVDVTDKSNPIGLARVPYETSGYSHQGWLTEDQAYFMHGDEGDEFLGRVQNTTTRVWDLTDLDDPTIATTFFNDTPSIDHNMYTEGDQLFQANYTTGLRVLDVSDPTDPRETAFFDVYPENDAATFEGGAWNVYPYFRQPNVVAVSSIDRGLFLLHPTGRG